MDRILCAKDKVTLCVVAVSEGENVQPTEEAMRARGICVLFDVGRSFSSMFEEISKELKLPEGCTFSVLLDDAFIKLREEHLKQTLLEPTRIYVKASLPALSAGPLGTLGVAGASGSSASDASSAVQLISKEVSKELSKELKPIAKGAILALQPVLSQLRRTSSATRSEGMRSGTFKKNLVQLKYNINDPMYLLDCSVTMLKLPSFAVLGAHIFPVRAANYLEYICPDIASIDDTHNGVLWAEPIEEAFESSSICFSWNEVNHTLTPRVLDINLLGKDMLAAYQYLKGKEGVELEVAEEAMPYEQMEIAVRSIYEQLEKSHLSSKQKEKQRTDQQEILRPYINFLYKKTSFDAINGVAIPFPAHIQLSVRAFQLSAAMAFNEAKQRGVLPPNLNFNPGIECGGDSGVIDLYLTSQVSSDDDDDDFISDSDSSFDIVPFVAARAPAQGAY